MPLILPPEGFLLERGGVLPELDVAYETYGCLDTGHTNAVLLCHALSGDAHAAGHHTPTDAKAGWWDEMIGPGKGLDTNRFFVICTNILGGCNGTTGPSSLNPRTGKPYGSAFPAITIGDMVRVQQLCVSQLGLKKLHAVMGGSMGGMQVLEWAIRFPDLVERAVCIASAASLSAQALAFDIVGRRSILSDPNLAGGDYYGADPGPNDGLATARMLGHITYLSPEIMDRKFGREKKLASALPAERFTTPFQIESYLRHQGAAFVERFDANSYLHITEAMDTYDIEDAHGSLTNAFRTMQARLLVVALSSDWLFPPEQSLEIATAALQAGRHVSYCLLRAPYGHDAFLVDIEHLATVVGAFLAPPAPVVAEEFENVERQEYALVRKLVPTGARVLDLGCGDGRLLAQLVSDHRLGLGVDISLDHVISVLARGLPVFQGDMDEGLAMIPDQSYDYAVLGETLQVVRRPLNVLREMLRVAREGIVSFPNFANWNNRARIGLTGRMPKSAALPFDWHDTPNIHLTTLRDFTDLCHSESIRITQIFPIAANPLGRLFNQMSLTNLGAERVLVKISRL
ncbi:MAG: homoserine O-acetyltransferase MetX [Kiritimatiellia bacterium]